MSSKPDLVVDWCSYQAAKYAVERWHYSGRMPKFKQVYLGVWDSSRFIGVIIFGLSVTPYLGNVFGLSGIECAELTRIALDRHREPVSKLAMIGLKMIKRQSPGLRLVVSYADPFHGHNGAIYQAMNWIHVGESSRVTQYYWRKAWRNDSPMLRYFKHYPAEREKCITRVLPPKYKYLYPLDGAMRRQIAPLAHPYPKREDMRPPDGSAEGAQLPVGGSTPTRTL